MSFENSAEIPFNPDAYAFLLNTDGLKAIHADKLSDYFTNKGNFQEIIRAFHEIDQNARATWKRLDEQNHCVGDFRHWILDEVCSFFLSFFLSFILSFFVFSPLISSS
jgi:hypothetical protein